MDDPSYADEDQKIGASAIRLLGERRAKTRAAPQTLRTVQDELLDERLARQNAEQEGKEEPQPV